MGKLCLRVACLSEKYRCSSQVGIDIGIDIDIDIGRGMEVISLCS